MKILHLTDIHIGGDWLSAKQDKLAINAVAAMVVQKSLTLLLLQVTLPTLCLMNLWHLTTYLLTQFLQLLWSLLVFIGFILFKKSQKIGLVVTVLLIVGFVFVEKNVMKLDVIFYDTILCFPLGMIFAVVKPFVDKILMKNDIIWTIAMCGIFTVFMYFALNRRETLNHLILFYACFPLVITVLAMKLNIKSSILDWFGNHIFSFFMLQRVPMMLMYDLELVKNSYLFIALSFFATVVLSTIFDECMGKLDKVIFKKRIKA